MHRSAVAIRSAEPGLKAALEEKEKALQELRQGLESLKAEKDRLSAEKDRLSAEKERLALESASLAADADSLMERLRAEKEDAEGRLAASSKSLTASEQQRGALERSLESVQNKFRTHKEPAQQEPETDGGDLPWLHVALDSRDTLLWGAIICAFAALSFAVAAGSRLSELTTKQEEEIAKVRLLFARLPLPPSLPPALSPSSLSMSLSPSISPPLHPCLSPSKKAWRLLALTVALVPRRSSQLSAAAPAPGPKEQQHEETAKRLAKKLSDAEEMISQLQSRAARLQGELDESRIAARDADALRSKAARLQEAAGAKEAELIALRLRLDEAQRLKVTAETPPRPPLVNRLPCINPPGPKRPTFWCCCARSRRRMRPRRHRGTSRRCLRRQKAPRTLRLVAQGSWRHRGPRSLRSGSS